MSLLGHPTPHRYFLGLDLSTQQLKAVILNENLSPVVHRAVHFDRDLPHYGTTGGCHIQSKRVPAPLLMWVEAVDVLFDQLAQDPSVPLDRIVAIGGAAQVNASTTRECREFEERLGGPVKVAELTGARAYERYTAHQITKLYTLQPDLYRRCHTADGSGMNLMDLGSRTWSSDALTGAVSDGSLGIKLGGSQGLIPTQQVVGNISAYWSNRYGLPRDCQVLAFTGDNPSTLAGLPMQDRDLAVSLGTSDTAFLATRQPYANLTDLVMSPDRPPALVYADGCHGHVGFYFNVPEILPHVHGIRRFAVDITSPITNITPTTSPDSLPPHCQPLTNFPDPQWNVRAIVESQALNMKIHIQHRGLVALDRILAVGGAAENQSLLQVWADVFGVPICQVCPCITASGGSALRSAFAVLCPEAANSDAPLLDYVRFLEQSCLSIKVVANPNPAAHAVYQRMEPIIERLLQYMEHQYGY
ncbi:hypothetical protein IWQ61_006420 [Dispira simplex]|nr:hypothetical protein IWQ61_006420 [Dispira simplex]